MPTNVPVTNNKDTTTTSSSVDATTTTTTTSDTKQAAPTTQLDTTDNMRHKDSSKQAAERGTSGARSGRNSLSSNGSDENRNFISSNADYDHIRNTTLMFFLDRLYIASKDGKEARTLHDLSCLFGTKEFTKEMRHIVGNSRNGLKNFLQCYPSLFTIDGDKVYLTQLKLDAVAPVRDYNKEAVDYFTQKLLQFGTSLVPIRNLFGYRSQASQEVRHVSGKNTKEFKQFLSAHSDVFEILADEHVVLKSAIQELESRGESYTSLQQTLVPTNEDHTVIDPYLNKQFAHMIEDCMKNMITTTTTTTTAGNEASALPEVANQSPSNKTSDETSHNRVTIEYLHERILKDCNNQLFLKMVKTIEDLKVFLRMHPRLFKRFKCEQDQKDYVSLITDLERKEMEAAGYPSLMMRQHSSLRRTATNESNLSDNSSNGRQPMSLPPQLLCKQQESSGNKQQQQQLDKQTTMSSVSKQQQKSISKNYESQANENNNNNSLKPRTTNNKPIQSSNQSKSINSTMNNQETSSNGRHSSLRATAPPFIPSTHQTTKRLPLQASNSSKPHYDSTTESQGPIKDSFVPMQRSVSNLGPASSEPFHGHHNQHHNHNQHHHHQQQQQHSNNHRAAIDPRAAIRSYLIKASAVNSSSGLYSPNKLSNGAQHHHQPAPLSRQSSNLVSDDDLRTRTVNIVREASNIVTRIMTNADAVAFDCKGYNLGFDGQITLIQFAFLPKTQTQNPINLTSSRKQLDDKENGNSKQKPEVCIFDLITNPELAYCLKPLLESEQVVKIVHDVRNKSNALFSQFGIMLNHVFDTQVANLVIQQQETGKPAYKSRYISMSRLCEIYGDESLTKYRNLIKSKTRHSGAQNNTNKVKDVNYWKTRPLTDAMVYESTMDVYCLVGGVYQNLKSRIIPEYRPLFEQLNLEGVLARIKPEEIRSVKKERKIDLEVIDLKRKLYSDTTSSIVLSNREIRLLRHIDLSEEVRQKIQQCKKVAKKLERLDMKAAQLQQQSMTSQVSSDVDHDAMDQSIDLTNTSVQTNGSSMLASGHNDMAGNKTTTNSSSTSTTNATTTDLQQARPDASFGDTTTRDGLFNDKGELDETKMDNLMNSSMFDELQDKMIETSSLLESLANDVDRDEVASDKHSVHKHTGSNEDCRCMCHRSSIGTQEGEKSNSSLKLSLSSHASSSSSADHDDASVESKAVDMAIQCDLLS